MHSSYRLLWQRQSAFCLRLRGVRRSLFGRFSWLATASDQDGAQNGNKVLHSIFDPVDPVILSKFPWKRSKQLMP
ncbi:MAG TPA: hypothetical protein DCR55_18125 [Lentisphaeria bacterium]|nr:hypothetical protein [Lentisphaeria bacterium]